MEISRAPGKKPGARPIRGKEFKVKQPWGPKAWD